MTLQLNNRSRKSTTPLAGSRKWGITLKDDINVDQPLRAKRQKVVTRLPSSENQEEQITTDRMEESPGSRQRPTSSMVTAR